MYVRACGKVNLFLNLVGKNSNGYHNIQSYFLKLQLADIIYLNSSINTSCTVEGAKISGKNIVLQAVNYLNRVNNLTKGIDIHIKKNIPVAAGLGGGSSNAASILKIVPKLWNIPEIYAVQLKEIALAIGADVPFFYNNKNAFVEGIGEVLTLINLEIEFFILLVNPGIKIITKQIYESVSAKNFTPKIVLSKTSIIKEIFHGKNDLEKYVVQQYPIIKDLLKAISYQNNCLVSRMSGSGPTCFGIFNRKSDVVDAANNILKIYPKMWIYYQKVKL